MQTCLLFLNTEDLQLPQTKNETPATVEPNATASTPATVESDPTASTPTQPSTRSGRKVHLPTSYIFKCFIAAILEKYNLQDEYKALEEASFVSKPQYEMPQDAYFKSIFRDKKLNKLWLKAEQQGFSGDQLAILKEEFQHHQNKIDQYYQMINQLHAKDPDDFNSNTVEHILQSEAGDKLWKSDNPHQILKEKHSELKAGYDYLHGRILPDIRSIEFEEPQVMSLWEMAKNASFSTPELESLKDTGHTQFRSCSWKNRKGKGGLCA
ncbi:alpha-2-macroglobulin receptor-associated protein [Trichonephila clavipes]|nr:alpha-2-macroglobulin receptor-associated protein [Trichonephila clavipes]